MGILLDYSFMSFHHEIQTLALFQSETNLFSSHYVFCHIQSLVISGSGKSIAMVTRNIYLFVICVNIFAAE